MTPVPVFTGTLSISCPEHWLLREQAGVSSRLRLADHPRRPSTPAWGSSGREAVTEHMPRYMPSQVFAQCSPFTGSLLCPQAI